MNDKKVTSIVTALAAATGHDERKPLRDSLRACGPAIATQLVPFLTHDDCFLRWEMVSLLGEFAHPDTALTVLTFALNEDEVHARWRSFWAVCRFETGVVLPTLLGALKRPASQRAWRAALILSMLRRPEAVPVLRRGLSSDDEWIRWEAVSSLKAIRPAGLVDEIGALLHTGQPRAVRQEAALALGNLPEDAAVAWLARALQDHEPQVRWRAAMALCRHGRAAALAPLRKQRRSESDSEVKKELKQAIARLEQRHANTQIHAA